MRLIGILRASLKLSESDKTFQLMHDAIVKVIGKDVLNRSRARDLVIGRTILAHSCAVLGWKERTIGELLHKDHASVNIMKKNMRYWIKHPNLFKKENDFYVKFIKEWNNETDR